MYYILVHSPTLTTRPRRQARPRRLLPYHHRPDVFQLDRQLSTQCKDTDIVLRPSPVSFSIWGETEQQNVHTLRHHAHTHPKVSLGAFHTHTCAQHGQLRFQEACKGTCQGIHNVWPHRPFDRPCSSFVWTQVDKLPTKPDCDTN